MPGLLSLAWCLLQGAPGAEEVIPRQPILVWAERRRHLRRRVRNNCPSNDEAARFLTAASFGPRANEVDQLSGQSASDWISRQARLPATLFLSDVLSRTDSEGRILRDIDSDLYWNKIIQADDQLRQRMVFALSQIVVISDSVIDNRDYQNQFAYYRDILSRNALGNYRTLLQEITYSPVMAEWLTYMQNRKGDPETGPDA